MKVCSRVAEEVVKVEAWVSVSLDISFVSTPQNMYSDVSSLHLGGD